MNWTRGLLRLWLVGSVLWAVPVGWVTWPGEAPQEYLKYWYYRIAHPQVLDELSANKAAATKQRYAALAEIRARYDATRVAPGPHQLTADEMERLWTWNYGSIYGRNWNEVSKEEADEVKKVFDTELAQPGSEQLQKFLTLERSVEWNKEQVSWWATYTFAPPIIVFIVGTSLMWAPNRAISRAFSW
jgi:hypothetical protein